MLDLPKYFRLSDDQGIQARGNGHGVLDCLAAVLVVDVLLQGGRELLARRQKGAGHAVGVDRTTSYRSIELSPVTG